MSDTIYEGTEKKLELLLNGSLGHGRYYADACWHRIVEACGARILSTMHATQLDAYLLSESSLFVWDDRIVMMTCGDTRVVAALPELIRFVGASRIACVLYERKNAVWPETQTWTFEDDVRFLRSFLPGARYRLGPLEGDHIQLYYGAETVFDATMDITLQLLMHDLQPAAAALFQLPENINETGAAVPQVTGLFPAMQTDFYFFSPTGFSMNGIDGSRYIALHVTPQTGGSYASFATNLPHADFPELLSQLLRLFRPARFSLMVAGSEKRLADSVLPVFATADMQYQEDIFDCCKLGAGNQVFLRNYTHPVRLKDRRRSYAR